MKIERLNENQIRCTLSKSELEQRELQLSELARGSAKARKLFSDLIQQASAEVGFDAENIPLMIEAIPISSDCLILVVTKIDDPEEFNERLSRFSRLAEGLIRPGFFDMDDDEDEDGDASDSEGSLLDPSGLSMEGSNLSGADLDLEGLEDLEDLPFIGSLIRALSEARKDSHKKKKEGKEPQPDSLIRVYAFRDLNQIISLSGSLVPFYQGGSTLYKDPVQEYYYLILSREDSPEDLFDRACTIASEYGSITSISYASQSYFNEHFQLMFETEALETLNELN